MSFKARRSSNYASPCSYITLHYIKSYLVSLQVQFTEQNLSMCPVPKSDGIYHTATYKLQCQLSTDLDPCSDSVNIPRRKLHIPLLFTACSSIRNRGGLTATAQHCCYSKQIWYLSAGFSSHHLTNVSAEIY